MVLLLCALAAIWVAPVFADSIRLSEDAGCAGPRVLLRDVAELDGPAAQKLGDVPVGDFTGKARQIKVSLDAVHQALADHGADFGQLTLAGFARCSVTRTDAAPPAVVAPRPAPVVANPRQEIALGSAVSLRDRIVDVLAQLTGVPRGDLRVEFSDTDAKPLGISALGPDRFEIEPQSSTGLGRVPLVVRQWDGEKLVGTIHLLADVSKRCLAVVASHAIDANQTIDASALEVREVFITDAQAGVMTDVKRVVGQTAGMSLREGTVICTQHLRSALLVRRGDVVTVRCIAGGLVVKTMGRATQDGALGQVIAVRNEHNHDPMSILSVRVSGPLEVVMQLTDSVPPTVLAAPAPTKGGKS